MVKNNLIKIDLVDVSSKRISVEIRDEYQEKISSAVIRFRFDVNTLTTISKFQEVIIWENFSGTLETDANRKFIGNIAKIERTTGEIKITCFGNLWKAIQTEVNQTFDKNIDSEAGEGSEIFINMSTLAGLTADSSSVQSTGTGATSIVLDKFVCKNAEIYERMQALADIYDFQFYYRPSVDKVFFEPRGFFLNSNVITVGGSSNNVQGFPKWTEDSSKIFNRVEIKGRFLEPKITESFNGDAAETTFTLNFEPEIVTVTVDGTEQVGGVSGSTSTFDYSVDKSNKQIVFESGSIPGSGTNNVVILYSYRVEKSVFRNNESSISELGRTIANRFTFSDIESVDDAERRADKLLQVYSDEFVTTKIKLNPSAVETFGLEAGQSIRVIDERQDKDLNMVIRTMISRFPENDVELLLGDKEVKIASIDFDNSKRLKRIEEELAKGSTFITESKDLVHTFNLSRRDIRVNQQDYDQAAGYSIWGLGTDDGFFDWGSGKWGTHDDAFEAEEEHTINQTNNIYDENFNDTDYLDSGNTTATWSGNGSVSFTSGQVAQSESFLLNDITVVSAILTPTEVSGSFDYELTANYLVPIAHYKMNDNLATTNVIDSAGSFDGTSQNNTDTMDVVGKINNALEFNSSNSDTIVVSDDNVFDNNNVSIALWIKTSDNNQDVIRKWESGSDQRSWGIIMNSNGKIRFSISTDGTLADVVSSNSITAIDDGEWHHIVATYDGTNLKIYIDKILEDTDAKSGTIFSSTSDIKFGVSFITIGDYNGLIDDVRIYNSASTQADVTAIYNSGNGTEEENANWETVTPNTRHFFTNSGTDLRFRTTENAASTGSLSNIKIEAFR